jgi:Transposase DDE domain
MTSIPEVARAMEHVLTSTAETVARPSGFVQRKSKLTGPVFAKATVLGWLAKPDSRLSDLTEVAAAFGVKISPQGLDERFTPQVGAFLEQLLEAAVGQVIAAEPVTIPILQRFNGVILQDSSTIGLPEGLAKRWPGCGNASHPSDESAALKLGVRLDVLHGTVYGPLLEAGRCQDRNCRLQTTPLPKHALRLADLGFFNLGVFQQIDAEQSYYLSRLHVQTAVFNLAGQRLNLLALLQATDELDLAVHLGLKERLRVRLLAVRVPQEVADQRRRRLQAEARRRGQAVSKLSLALADWTILVTNVPKALLSLQEALVLIRVRWQVELLFKLWKQHAQVDEWRSQQPWRIVCEVYAKLIGVVLQHWLFLLGCWTYRDRSLVKAAATVRAYGMMLVSALAHSIGIVLVLSQIRQALAGSLKINRRAKHPNTYQLLLDLTNAA